MKDKIQKAKERLAEKQRLANCYAESHRQAKNKLWPCKASIGRWEEAIERNARELAQVQKTLADLLLKQSGNKSPEESKT